MATGLKRLLLIRKKDVRSNLMDQFGFSKFIKQSPIPIHPVAWNDNAPLSHYGYVLEGLMLTDLEELADWEAKYTGATLLAIEMKDKKSEETVEEVLAKVGLRVSKLGPDKLLPKAQLALPATAKS